MKCRITLIALVLSMLALGAAPALAQSFELDARRIGIGGVGSGDNPSQGMVPDQPNYHAIILPFGLVQVFKNKDIFDPNANAYNPVLAVEYAANPLHIVFNRAAGDTSGPFVNDLANGVSSRDLNTYRGFAFPSSLTAAGLIAPHWGATLHVQSTKGGYQGVYIGVGPYISLDTDLTADSKLVNLLASTTNVFLPNSTFGIQNTTHDQLAGALTLGYRGRFALASGRGSRDGVYLAANYNVLHGFRYDAYQTNVRFDTDANGLLTIVPSTQAIVANRMTSNSGSGHAIDLGAEIVVNGFDFGFGASGLDNKITWDSFTNDTWVLGNILTGGSFVHTAGTPVPGSVDVTLPVRTTANAGYTAGPWTVETELNHGLLGAGFNGGVEHRGKAIDLRAGGRYVKQQWHGSAGLGLNMSRKVGLDLALFGESANLERNEKLALAVSLRINAGKKK